LDRGCQQPTLTEQERQALWQLRARWLALYRVAFVDQVWRANPYNDATRVLTADAAAELGDRIEADYASVILP
jgi:hypothetical protein